ncbi:MAG: EamA/RhaT family transporter [Clostridia bacterium]|nr:EamA/RhaT family transporter [Clostridia bacterium]
MKLKGFIYAIISAVFFGSAGIFVKSGYSSDFTPVDLLMLQYIIGSIILFLMSFIKYRGKLKLSKDMVKKLIIQGAIGNTLMTVFFYEAFRYLDVAVTTMLLFTYPAMVALAASLIFKQRISQLKLALIAGTFLGCILVLDVFTKTSGINYIGVAFALLSAFFYAFMNLHAERIVEDLPGLVITFYTTVFSLIVLFIFNFDFVYKLPEVSLPSFVNAALLAFFCEIIPLTLLYEAIKRIGPVSTSIITSLELPASAITAFVFLGERLTLTQIIGILTVVYCVIKLKKE